MVMPRSSQSQDRHPQRSLGFFLQCNGESESTSWSCYAVAELRLLAVKEGQEPFSRSEHTYIILFINYNYLGKFAQLNVTTIFFIEIQHLFYNKENDWGFSHFMLWQEVLDPDKGYVKDDAITLEVCLH